MALNSAYQQTKENKAQGGGMFAGANDPKPLDMAGKGGGLAGAMSNGLRSAGDFMSNLASGTGGAAKESLQKSTTGGAVSANIDASRQENQATHDVNKASSDGGGSDGGGDGATSDDGGPEGGGSLSSGSGDMSSSGGDAGGGAESGGSESSQNSFSLSKPGYDGGDGSLSKPGYGSSDGGTSLSKPRYGGSDGSTSMSKPGYRNTDRGSSFQ